MTTTVTITVSNGAMEQTFTHRGPFGLARLHDRTTPRQDAARLLVAAFGDAAKLYREEIAEDVAAVRLLLDAFGAAARVEAGICGERGPAVASIDPGPCSLKAGHAGWHHTANGADFTTGENR